MTNNDATTEMLNPDAGWMLRAVEVDRFYRRLGQIPNPGATDPAESRSGRWLARQRLALCDGALTRIQGQALDAAANGWRHPYAAATAHHGTGAAHRG